MCLLASTLLRCPSIDYPAAQPVLRALIHLYFPAQIADPRYLSLPTADPPQ
jgi:hypothetical protein